MERFSRPQDPLFAELNSSVRFDWRLAPYDIDQSRAHARALLTLGVLDEAELKRIDEGLERISRELDEGSFRFDEGDEDIHMAIERRLTEIVGPLGGKIHTARSRNDQVATDLAMFVRAHSLRAIDLIAELMRRVLSLAERHRDWPMPGYTHLQRAQPVYLAHHLLAYLWMFHRDARRFQHTVDATRELPAGSGAIAGVNWTLDREAIARDLGFASTSQNSIDAVSNRDFALDYLAAASIAAVHLSRLGSEIVLWSSQEFGFCDIGDSFSSGSSIMPQKRNPDAAELMRAKGPRVAADLASLTGTMHALPLAYSKDLQEDKEPLFDAVDNLELCVAAAAEMLGSISFNKGALEAAASDEFLAATDLADLMVRHGVPFRKAHGVVTELVRAMVDEGRELSDISNDDLPDLPADALETFRRELGKRGLIESKVSRGGTGSGPLQRQLDEARRALSEVGG
jgi:argininosuccinate lyase